MNTLADAEKAKTESQAEVFIAMAQGMLAFGLIENVLSPVQHAGYWTLIKLSRERRIIARESKQ
ncbi:MAG: hypothetical protein J6N20_15230 [Pseudomonas sp.]|nr:hypothetical protein [Pseudomonas sp.]